MTFGKIKTKWLKLVGYIFSKEILLAVLIAIAVIVTGLFLGWYNNKVVPVNPTQYAHYTQEPNNRLSFMSDWDGPIYLGIARHGYQTTDDTGFFPLYPLSIRAVSLVVGSPLYSALLVSWFSLIGAIYFFIKILKRVFNIPSNREALRGTLLFILFPPAVVLIATYSESLFALLSFGAIYFALSKRYLLAASLTALATATRIDGVFVLVLILLILAEQKERLARILFSTAIGSLGLLTYMTFLLIKFHNPFEFVIGQKSNGWLAPGYFRHLVSTFSILDTVVIVLLVTAFFYWWKRRKSFAIYSLLFLGIPLLGRQFSGFERYAIMAFPFQLMLYGWLRNKKLAFSLVIALFGIFWGYFLLQYAGGYTGI